MYSTLTGPAGADVTSRAGDLPAGGGVRTALLSGLESVLLFGPWLWKLLESLLRARCSVMSVVPVGTLGGWGTCESHDLNPRLSPTPPPASGAVQTLRAAAPAPGSALAHSRLHTWLPVLLAGKRAQSHLRPLLSFPVCFHFSFPTFS